MKGQMNENLRNKIKDSKKHLGIGNSKKEAEQKAALKLLDTFKK